MWLLGFLATWLGWAISSVLIIWNDELLASMLALAVWILQVVRKCVTLFT